MTCASLDQLRFLAFLSHYITISQMMIDECIPLLFLGFFLSMMFAIPVSYLVNNIAHAQCHHTFSDLANMSYLLIKTIFNMVSFDVFPSHDYVSLYINHSLFVIIFGIMYLNMVIAVFSDSVTFVSKHKDIYDSCFDTILVYSNSPQIWNSIVGHLWKYKEGKRQKIYLQCVK